jgi:hypothetical protein
METQLAVAFLDGTLSCHFAKLVFCLALGYRGELQAASSLRQYSEDLIGPCYLDYIHQSNWESVILSDHTVDFYMIGIDNPFRFVSGFRVSQDVPQ